MSDHPLPYGRQHVTEADIAAVAEVLAGDYLTTGPMVGRFEAALALAGGARRAVVVSSGTAALHAAYFATGLGPGDELITSPLTFAATANAALYLGVTVRFADVEAETGNLDAELLSEALSERTRAVVPVDYAGHPADYDRIRAALRGRDSLLISDAAHSLGASYRGRHVGSLADVTTTSFHPVKPITSAEGGAVLGNSTEVLDRVARFRDHGISRPPPGSAHPEGPWFYEMRELGFNYRLSDVHCALGLTQLTRLGAHIARRREIAARYSEAFADLAELILPMERDEVTSGWHLYVIRVRGDSARRRPFFERLRELQLGVQVHYIPVYFHPYYASLGYRRGACPCAEDFYARCVSIPIFPAMSDQDVDATIERVRRGVADTL